MAAKGVIVAVPNVWNSALRVLSSRGYQLDLTCQAQEGADIFEKHRYLTWHASNGEIELVASNPTELLGLANIAEHHSDSNYEPYWWVVAGEDIQENLYEKIGISFIADKKT